MMDQPVRQATREDYEARIIRVQEFIHEHMDEALSLNGLADVACLSQYHFHRIFIAMVGETPAEYLRRLRLERAAALLTRGEARVGEAALSAGYESPEAFSRAFRDRYGMPPATYRHHHFDRSITEGAPEFVFRPKVIRLTGVHMEVKIEKLGPYNVAYVSHIGPYIECTPAWVKLCGSKQLMEMCRPGTLFLSLCYDDPQTTAPDQIRLDACMTVGADFTGDGDIKIKEIPAGEFAVLRHTGPYTGLLERYKYVYSEWLPDSGREPADAPCMEIYRNNPQKTPEDKLITDICVPLK
ncbi:AraC family transcriptional regulator [bacterium]|nr:AraC family transcriptional regulator [bacterium]